MPKEQKFHRNGEPYLPEDKKSKVDYASLADIPTNELNLRLGIVEAKLASLEQMVEFGEFDSEYTKEEQAAGLAEHERQAAVLRFTIRERVRAGEVIEPVVVRANNAADFSAVALSPNLEIK